MTIYTVFRATDKAVLTVLNEHGPYDWELLPGSLEHIGRPIYLRKNGVTICVTLDQVMAQ